MQEAIHAIITHETSKQEKIKSLRSLFHTYHDVVFSDLDDTITPYDAMLFSRIYIMRRFFPKLFADTFARQKLFRYVSISRHFVELMRRYQFKKVIILSRSNFHFLEELSPYLAHLLGHFGIELIGIVGSCSLFRFTSEDKIRLMRHDDVLISDVFEKQVLSRHPNFLLVENLSRREVLLIKINKLFAAFFFLLRLFFVGKNF